MDIVQIHRGNDDLDVVQIKLTGLCNHATILDNARTAIVVQITTVAAFLIGQEIHPAILEIVQGMLTSRRIAHLRVWSLSGCVRV